MRGLVTFAACLVPCAWLAIPATAQAQVGSIILVTTTEDIVDPDERCSLREAIIASNTNSIGDDTALDCRGTGTDSIRFALDPGTPQIDIFTALPEITAPVTIRGDTGAAQPGVLHGPGSGGAAFSGLVIKANGTTVRGLVINNFGGNGIVIQATHVTLTGNLIGTGDDGASPLGNSGNGVDISGPFAPSDHVIGGTGAGEANVIAFNGGSGVSVSAATGNAIRGNSIHDNGFLGINNTNGGNGEGGPPLITHADVDISGISGCSFCTVDLYADSGSEGETYLGSTPTAGDGSWVLNVPASGPTSLPPSAPATARRSSQKHIAARISTMMISATAWMTATSMPSPTPSTTVSSPGTAPPSRTPAATASSTATPTTTAISAMGI